MTHWRETHPVPQSLSTTNMNDYSSHTPMSTTARPSVCILRNYIGFEEVSEQQVQFKWPSLEPPFHIPSGYVKFLSFNLHVQCKSTLTISKGKVP